MEDEMARNSLLLDQAVESGEKKKKSRKGLIIGIAMLAVVPVIGSTLAASITLNSGNDIEFGQGTESVVACDTDGIGVDLTSSYVSSTFKVATVVLSGIATTCNGKDFVVTLRDSSGTAISGGTLSFTYSTSGAVTIGGSSLATPAPTQSSGTLTLTPATLPAAANVTQITLETN
jgi:hypothetical protein